MDGVFLDTDSLHPQDLDLSVLESCLPRWRFHDAGEAADTAERLAAAEVVVTNKVVLDAALIDAADRLRLICVAATGTDNVDLEAAARRGIPVCNARGYATPSVAEHVFGLLLTLVRRLDDYRDRVRRGEWAASRFFCLFGEPMQELAGRTLGIVGHGELGRAVADIARAFSMQVLVAQRPGGDSRPGRLPLPELLARSDVLSLHCPLTAATRNLIDADALRQMKPGALLINTARGGLVDEAALLQALRDGRLGGAALDVLEREPPPARHALVGAGLPNLLITPHVAWASRPARQRLVDEIAANIRAFLDGRPRNRVV